MRGIEPGLHGEPRRLAGRLVGVARHAHRLADDDGAAAEGQPDRRAVPAVEIDPPAGDHGDRMDRPARGTRQRDDAGAADPGALGDVGGQHHRLAGREPAHHGEEGRGAALFADLLAHGAGAADRADAELA